MYIKNRLSCSFDFNNHLRQQLLKMNILKELIGCTYMIIQNVEQTNEKYYKQALTSCQVLGLPEACLTYTHMVEKYVFININKHNYSHDTHLRNIDSENKKPVQMASVATKTGDQTNNSAVTYPPTDKLYTYKYIYLYIISIYLCFNDLYNI